MILALEIIAIIAIAFFIGISIAAFVIFYKIFQQLQYNNYILEKLNRTISESLSSNNVKDSFSDDISDYDKNFDDIPDDTNYNDDDDIKF